MKKIFLLMFVFVLMLVPLVSAEGNLGMFESNKTVSLFQTCDSCTYVNISSVKLPNGTITIINEEMTKSGTSYTYDYYASLIGDYQYEVCGDKDGVLDCEIILFEVTYSGKKLSSGQGIIFLGLMLVIIFLFLLSLFGISKLPSEDVKQEDGSILEAGNLKHFRKALFLFSWILLTAIFYLSSNISFAYLSTDLFGKFLFTIYQIMYKLILPIIFLILIWIFVSIFKDREMKKILERGGGDFGDI